MCEQMHFAESHTAAHDEKQRSILGKTEMAAHILLMQGAQMRAAPEYREEAVFLPGCRRMQTPGSDPCAEPHSNRSSSLPRTECTRNRWQRQRRESSAVLSVSSGQCFRRIKMCGDNGIKMVLINIICKRISKPRICIVNGDFQEISVPAHQADRVRRSRPEKRRRASHKLRRPVRRYAFVRGSSDPEPRLRGDKNSDFLLMQRPQHCGHRQYCRIKSVPS